MINKETEIVNAPSAYIDLTKDLKVDGNPSSTYEPVRITEEFKL